MQCCRQPAGVDAMDEQAVGAGQRGGENRPIGASSARLQANAPPQHGVCGLQPCGPDRRGAGVVDDGAGHDPRGEIPRHLRLVPQPEFRGGSPRAFRAPRARFRSRRRRDGQSDQGVEVRLLGLRSASRNAVSTSASSGARESRSSLAAAPAITARAGSGGRVDNACSACSSNDVSALQSQSRVALTCGGNVSRASSPSQCMPGSTTRPA